jgi:predicted DNA-binding transcriptional regulator AlpA
MIKMNRRNRRKHAAQSQAETRSVAPISPRTSSVLFHHRAGISALDPILTINEIAELDGTSVATIRRGIRAGRGPPIIQLSARRIGVRQSDYEAHCEARVRRP